MAGRAAQSSLSDTIPPEFSDSAFLFTYSLLSGSCGEKEKGQTDNSTDLSNLAPLPVEMLNLWKDFRKVVQFIDENENWVKPLLAAIKKNGDCK